jgi:GTP-binding protein Era
VIDQVSSLSLSREACGVFLVLNKVDRMNKQQLLPLIERYQQFRNWTEVVPISAKTGMNVDRLLQVTLACLPENGTQGYEEDYITDQSMREMAAEFIREKILEQTRSELPYAVAVVIDQFLEEGSQARISATIVVDKASQKGIVIGKGGQRLKTIGTAARLDMEREFGLRIFLELWVKVQEGWRDNDRMLVEFGY